MCMKIQIIRIEEYDNLFSLKEKITHAKAARLILTDNSSSPIIQNLKMARLVKRCAQRAGREMGIVTRNPDATLVLRDAKINTFPDIITAQQFRWEFDSVEDLHKFPSIQPRSRFVRTVDSSKILPIWLRYISFGSGILSVIILALIFIPGADVTLRVPSQIQQIQIPAVIVKSTDSRSFKPLVLQPITVEAEAFHTIQVKGTKLIPYGKAEGEIEFTNLTPDPIQIPEGLILVSTIDLTKEYVTTDAGELNGGPDARLTLSVNSVLPGTAGNAEPGEVTTVLGSFGLRVGVRNPNAIIGGTEVEQPYPSTEDINQLRALTTDDVKKIALEKVAINLKNDLILLPQTLGITEVISDEYFPVAITSTSNLSLTLKTNVTIFAVSKEQIAAFSKPYLDALLPGNYSGKGEIEIDNFQVEKINSDGSIRAAVDLKRTIKRIINPDEVTELIYGKSIVEAKQGLTRQYQLETPALISERPGWLKILPFLPFRIRVLLVG